MENVEKAWIQTFTGKKFHLLDPHPDEIDIRDIAHSLAMQCRFTGHVKHHYSVAQHSIYVSQIVPPEDALWGLLHDASEAYMSDLNRPLKYFTPIGPLYLQQEAKVMQALTLVFGIERTMPASVHKADGMLLYAEKEQLLNDSISWNVKWGGDTTPADIKIERWSLGRAEQEFLDRFDELYREANTFAYA